MGRCHGKSMIQEKVNFRRNIEGREFQTKVNDQERDTFT